MPLLEVIVGAVLLVGVVFWLIGRRASRRASPVLRRRPPRDDPSRVRQIVERQEFRPVRRRNLNARELYRAELQEKERLVRRARGKPAPPAGSHTVRNRP